MSVEVATLEHDDVERASQLLARAFAADPIITFYLRGRRRKRAVPHFFAAVLEQMLPSGHVYVARVNGRLVGASAWLPPDVVEPPDSANRRARATSTTGSAALSKGIARSLRGLFGS